MPVGSAASQGSENCQQSQPLLGVFLQSGVCSRKLPACSQWERAAGSEVLQSRQESLSGDVPRFVEEGPLTTGRDPVLWIVNGGELLDECHRIFQMEKLIPC